ncbi:Hypothetical protein RAK1035_1790 [Roseovarius sp. AK1035]|nr:Hypothetical protein RAK1035_1790 [Roseovarius sp. AK1035]
MLQTATGLALGRALPERACFKTSPDLNLQPEQRAETLFRPRRATFRRLHHLAQKDTQAPDAE